MYRYFKEKLHIDHLDGFGSFHRLLWRNSHFTLTKKLLHKEGDVAAGNWDVLYTTTNDITLSLNKEQNRFQWLALKLHRIKGHFGFFTYMLQ